MRVEVRKIIGSKNPTLLKRLPSFVINWLERFIHQDLINQILEEGEGQEGADFIDTVFRVNDVKIESEFIDRIPKKGGVIIAANHPLGGLDGMALMLAVSKVRSDFLFLANDILMNITPLKKNFLPVNRVGTNAREALSMISEAYGSGKAILIFPSGFVSRKINGKIQDLPWQKSVIAKARQHDLPIIPVFVHGKNSKRFYRISSFRKIFGIKINFEMFTLPDEMFKQKGKTIKMTFGNLIPTEKIAKGKPQEVADKMRLFLYSLEKEPNAVYN